MKITEATRRIASVLLPGNGLNQVDRDPLPLEGFEKCADALPDCWQSDRLAEGIGMRFHFFYPGLTGVVVRLAKRSKISAVGWAAPVDRHNVVQN